MTLFALHYVYDERADERTALRPAHLSHFRALADGGRVPAIGRYGDSGQPGALIILDVESLDEAEQIAAADPYMIAGLVPEHTIREWPAFGSWPARAFPA